ncbi:MAG: hypothetical protein MUC67_13140, partial [Acidobacteria bacterium]|nr:hypothetical protein [Acidobacteriota bacterium]
MTEPVAFPTPAWWDRCRQALMSGSTKAIILHLNTRDYAVPGNHMTTYLCKLLANRDVVAIYNRATGITFPLESMEGRARDLLGMKGPAAGSGVQNAALAALGLPAAGPKDQGWPKPPAQALPLLERLMLSGARVTVIVEYAETLLPAA